MVDVEDIRYLPVHGKLVLLSIVVAYQRRIERPTTGDVYRVYRELAGKAGVSVTTKRRIADYLRCLTYGGVIKSIVISRERYGKTRMIQSLNVPEADILKNLAEDPIVGDLITSLGLKWESDSLGKWWRKLRRLYRRLLCDP